MTEYESVKQQKKKSDLKQMRETLWRLSAPVHVTLNSYKEHKRIEGYYEFQDYGHLFRCDRLLKLETVYGKVQLGYNPNRKRSFVFANMKTNLYDTVNSRYQKIMKEYQQRPEQKKVNENRAYVSGRWKNAAVLFEKAKNKPWSEGSMQPYFQNANMEAVLKTMPFFGASAERAQLEEKRESIHGIQEQIRQNAAAGHFEQNASLHREQRELSEQMNLLQAVLYRKDAGRRGFIRKLNYAFDIEKKEMFVYYRQQRARALREEVERIAAVDAGENPAADNNEKGEK